LIRRSGKTPALIERETGRPVVVAPPTNDRNENDNNQQNPPEPQLKHRGDQTPK
jgi:hypothetical protein